MIPIHALVWRISRIRWIHWIYLPFRKNSNINISPTILASPLASPQQNFPLSVSHGHVHYWLFWWFAFLSLANGLLCLTDSCGFRVWRDRSVYRPRAMPTPSPASNKELTSFEGFYLTPPMYKIPVRVELLGFPPDLWIVMNGVNRNDNPQSFGYFNSIDGCSFGAKSTCTTI